MKIYNGIKELVGNTKLVYIENFCKKYGIKAKICLKLESGNPAGSVKDRAALYMIEDAEKRGLIKSGATIIEPTSGNTGIGLAAIGRAKGYKVILTMPDTMSIERRNLLKSYGAEVVLTNGELGMRGAIEKANELHENIPNSFIAGQFENPANALAHYKTTGPEIWSDTDGQIAAFIAGVGTGATVSGTGKYLKEQNSNVKIIAVEPISSPMITKGKSAPHKIQGIGANFIPANYKAEYVDEVIAVSNEDAYKYGKEVATCEGILVGISSGANLAAAVNIAKSDDFDGKIIVCIAADSGEHYLSVEDYL